MIFLQSFMHNSLGMSRFKHVLHGEEIIFPPSGSAALWTESKVVADGKDEYRTGIKWWVS
jgi:hypothetical protein